MKITRFTFIPAALTAVALVPAFALEAPEDDSPPPPAERNGKALPEIKLPAAPKPAAKMEAAFLGIVSSDIPDMLADHLGLKAGEGVVVRSLVPNGPAAAAGVAMHDVITKVGGEAVGSPAEVSTRVTSHKPGDKVTLDLIHKGKPVTLDVTLGVKPAEIANAEPQTLDQLDLQGLPKELAERVRDAIQGNLGGMNLDDELQGAGGIHQAMRDMQKRMGEAVAGGILEEPADDKAAKPEVQGSATIRMMDQQGSVEVKAKDGAKEVTIRDKSGAVTWSGPWDTAQDKAAAPADIRARVEALNIDDTFKGGGLRLQMRQGAPDVLPGIDE